MRWNNLFDDLESQLEQELSAPEVDLQGEEERLRLGRLCVRDRLLSVHHASTTAQRSSIRVTLTDGTAMRIQPLSFGKDWVSVEVLEESGRRAPAVVPLAAIGSILLEHGQVAASLLSSPVSEPHATLSARLSLSFVLRDICRRRSPVDLQLAIGALHGTIDRVGRDHFDVATHEPGTARRDSAVSDYRIVPFVQLLVVRL